MDDNNAQRDGNFIPSIIGVSSADGVSVVPIYVNPITHRVLVDNGGSSSGIISINGDTTSAQVLNTGTTGTDFTIVDEGSGTHTFEIPSASASARGLLTSTDWSTFNGKQAAGSYITALTGDVTASGPGSVAATLATVNASPGTYTNATVIVNGKGLVTSASSGSVTSGTVTSVSVVSTNGFAGTVATATTTPAITIETTITGILKGNGTAVSAATAGTDYVTASSTNTFTNKTFDTAGTGNVFDINGTGITAVTGTGAVVLATSPTLVSPALGTPTALVGTNITGTGASFTAGHVTTNANLTGPITSSGNATSIAAQTGTGTTFVVQQQPVLTSNIPTTAASSGASSTTTFDMSTGNVQNFTFSGSSASDTVTFALSNVTTNQIFLISVTQNSGGSGTVTWMSTVRWAGGSPPTLTTTASKRDTFGFICTGSGTYDGFIIGLNI